MRSSGPHELGDSQGQDGLLPATLWELCRLFVYDRIWKREHGKNAFWLGTDCEDQCDDDEVMGMHSMSHLVRYLT